MRSTINLPTFSGAKFPLKRNNSIYCILINEQILKNNFLYEAIPIIKHELYFKEVINMDKQKI